MSGEQLYNKWVFAMADEGINVDTWGDLEEPVQNAWEAVAQTIPDRS